LPQPDRQACSVEELVQQSLSTSNLGDAVIVDFQIPADLPNIWVDPRQIPIVFRNLFRNASDAMKDGGTLQISAGIVNTDSSQADTPSSDSVERCPQVWVSVSDSGTGIEPRQLARITEPFFSTKARGMGLGLAISRAIIDKNTGRILVESELGRGTTFTIELPVAIS
jgi:two-component system sensor kinase FixL